MYTAISIDVFIAAYSGCLGGMRSQRNVSQNTNPAHYSHMCNVALAFAEAFDTEYANPLPNDLQITEIESIVSEQMNGRQPGAPGAASTAFWVKPALAIIALLSEADGVVAANVTNPIPFPTPGGGVPVVQINTVTGATNSLKSTTPATPIAVIVDGYYDKGDGLNIPLYYWDPTDTTTPNDGTVVEPTGHIGPGRWIGISGTGPIQVGWFGATANATTIDDGIMGVGSDVLTSVSAPFTPDMVGMTILINAASDPATGTVQTFAGQRFIQGTGTAFLTEFAVQYATYMTVDGQLNAIGAFLVLSDTQMYMTWPAISNGVGKRIFRKIQQLATITAYISPTQVHTSYTGQVGQAAIHAVWGTPQQTRIEAAINEAIAAGRDVEFGPGSYPINANMGFSGAIGTIIRGQGMFATEIVQLVPYDSAVPVAPNYGVFAFPSGGASGVTIKDMTINYSCPLVPIANSTTLGMKATFFDACPNCTVEYVQALGCRDEAIYAQADCPNWHVSWCKVKTVSNGINLNSNSFDSAGLMIDHCEVSSTVANALLLGTRGGVVSNNDLHSTTPADPSLTPQGADLIVCETAGRIVFADNLFRDVDLTDAGVAVIKMFGATDDPSSVISITDNEFVSIAGDFIDGASACISMNIVQFGEFSLKGVCNIQGNTFHKVTAPGRVNARYVFIEGPDTGVINILNNVFNSDVGSNMTTIVTIDADVPVDSVRLGTNTLSPVVTVQANGNFVVIPIVNQQQVTNNTTGAPTNQLVDVTTGGLADPVKTNNNFATLLAALQACAVVRN